MPLTDTALEQLLRVSILGESGPGALFLGLIAKEGFTGLAPSDTLGSHPGWTEFLDYEPSTRPQITNFIFATFVVGPPSTQAFGNFNARLLIADNDGNDNGPIRFTRPVAKLAGWFVCNNSVKGSGAGDLIVTGTFDFGQNDKGVIVPSVDFYPVAGISLRTPIVDLDEIPTSS